MFWPFHNSDKFVFCMGKMKKMMSISMFFFIRQPFLRQGPVFGAELQH